MLAIIHIFFQFIEMDRHQRHPNELFLLQAAAKMKLYQWSRDYFKTKLGEAVPNTDVADVTQPCKSGLNETCVRHREARSS